MKLLLSVCCILFPLVHQLHAAPLQHHQLEVKLIPSRHRIEATDRVTLPVAVSRREIALNSNLQREVRWLDERSCEVSYTGVINDPLRNVGEEHARGQKYTAGSIGPGGVYLDPGSGWYPLIPAGPERWMTFDLKVELPAGWDAVSQCDRIEHRISDTGSVVRWVCGQPQAGIWLVAGRYTEYSRRYDDVTAMAFFRRPERELAKKYLEAAGGYIGMYAKLIGPYPYSKFALVENFWETGYGMPSFTLLGPRVIRFPFILESSYPHEILHNWWGNSVYIDYGSGNWGEGLTAYLSDHLLKERKGLGAQHRMEALQKYADYVLSGRDLPLSAFRSRHGSVTEAVGYGKSMMMFHMLRLHLGDSLFREGLGRLYSENLYETASFMDVQKAFEAVSETGLGWFFDQWVLKTGAPVLEIEESAIRRSENGSSYDLKLELRQVQDGGPYRLKVPVAVTLEGEKEARVEDVVMSGAEETVSMRFSRKPVRVDVDPGFDLFRRLDRREIPPALTRAFGARKALIILPSRARPDLLASYRQLARSLTRTGPGKGKVAVDSEITDLPDDASVYLLGWENRHLPGILQGFEDHGVEVDSPAGLAKLGHEASTVLEKGIHSIILAGNHPLDPDLAVLWIAADNTAAHPGLARKLPHYHKYSYLAFTGDEPENMVKGRWPVRNSPLTAFPGGGYSPRGKLPGRADLLENPVLF